MAKFIKQFAEGDLESLKESWQKFQHTAKQLDDDILKEIIQELLIWIALEGSALFARQLIENSELTEELFPLARAIDYMQKG